MSFPATVLNVTVELALGADLTAAPSTWSWTDVTTYVYVRDSIRMTHGGFDGSTQIPPSTLAFTANNRDGRWCEYNPSGTWFGQLSRGTPVRVKVDEGTASVRMTGFIVSLPPRWDPSENDGHVPVTAAGVTRRLQRGSAPLKSALTTALSGGAFGGALTTAPFTYWTGEDGSGATTLAEFYGGSPMILTGTVTPASSGPDGSKSLPALTSAGGLNGTVTPYTSTNEWSVGMVFNIPASPSRSTTILRWLTTGSLARWQVTIDPSGSPDTILIQALDSSSALQVNASMNFAVNTISEPYGYWLVLTASAVQNGANIDYEFALYLESSAATNSGSVAGTMGVVTNVAVPPSSTLDGAHVGHIAVWDAAVDTTNVLSYVEAAVDGHAGESAHTRLTRLGSESGVDVEVDSTGTGTMGPQPIAAFLTAARECVDVNNGRLFDNRDPTAFDALMRVIWSDDIIHQAAALALDHDSGHLAPPFEPTSDDQSLRNDWTASRSGGSSARVFATTGKLTPALVGTYDDSVTVNVESDDDLPHQAGWRTLIHTVEGLRFPHISLDFARNPSLIASWINCEIGSRVTASNPPDGMSPDQIDVIIEGWTETINSFAWRVDLNCSPYKPWQIGVLASTTGDTGVNLGWLDWDSCVLQTAVDTDDTSWTVAAYPDDSTTADDFPRQSYIGGELVTVTASTMVNDQFGRTVASGWGTATTGPAWTTSGGAASDHSTNGGAGQQTITSTNVNRFAVLAVGGVDYDYFVDVQVNVNSAGGANLGHWVCGRVTDINNLVRAVVDVTTAGAVQIRLSQRVGGTSTDLSSTVTVGTGHASGDAWRVRVQGQGTAVRAKAWRSTEPTAWSVEGVTTLTTGSSIGLVGRRETGNTDAGTVFTYDHLTVTSAYVWTVTRNVNGITGGKSHSAGAEITLAHPLVLSL